VACVLQEIDTVVSQANLEFLAIGFVKAIS